MLEACHISTISMIAHDTDSMYIFIQGNWVVKSEVLYPKDSHSDLLGLPGETMRRSRNYLLVQLQNSPLVTKSQLANTLRLPHEELDQLLTQLTVHDGHDR